MRITVEHQASPGDRFATSAFDGAIGKPVKFAGQNAVLVAAKVEADGMTVLLTFDVDDDGQLHSALANFE